ncbi:hypothetical protein QVL69_07240, partial [Bartonella henselae]|nr:hypothetical protein [Bartonella henselae]
HRDLHLLSRRQRQLCIRETMSNENRRTELEIKLMDQEKILDEIFCVVIEQWKSLDEISKKIIF